MASSTDDPSKTDYLGLLRLVRHPARARSSALLPGILDSFVPFDSPDPALIAGTGSLDGRRVTVFAQQKPIDRSMQSAAEVNYGMMRGTGYWFVLERMAEAAARGEGLLTLIDTPGADPSKDGQERKLAWAISSAIAAFLAYPGPTVSIVIGEGGSGGALALQVADRRLMVSDAMYSVISPESCSAILFRKSTELERAMAILRPSAHDALRCRMIDGIVDWSNDVSIADHEKAGRQLRTAVRIAFDEVARFSEADRKRRRSKTMLHCGVRKSAVDSFRPEEPSTVFNLPTSVKRRVLQGMSMLPEAPRDQRPKMHKLVPIGGEENSTIALLQHAYYASATKSVVAGPRVLCIRGQGGCGAVSAEADYIEAGWACPACGAGERLSARQWASVVCDPGTFQELYAQLDLSELDDAGYDTDDYRTARARAREQTGSNESLRIGVARIEGHPCAVAFSEFGFLGGTLGAVAGEKIRILCDIALAEHLPLVTVTCSGGARMQEGLLGLAQMAKTNAAILRLLENNRPHVSVLADPCTGGALASYATFATAILGEPRALIAFAGPRVLKLAGLPVDERELTSESAERYGGIDEVVERRRLRGRIARYLQTDRTSALRQMRPPQTNVSEILHSVETFVSKVSALLIDDAPTAAGPPNDVLRAALVHRLAKLALSEIPLLLHHVARGSDARARANAVEVLAQFPETPSTLLDEALSDAHHRVRANAAVMVLQRDSANAEAIRTIQHLTTSHDPLERRAALFAIVRLRLPALEQTVLSMRSDPDANVRMTAVVALFALGHRDVARDELSTLLGELGHYAVATLGTLERLLPADLRAEFAEALANSKAEALGGAS